MPKNIQVQIDINPDEINIKEISLHLTDGRELIVTPPKFNITVSDNLPNTFSLNLSKKINNFQQFIWFFNYHRDKIRNCKILSVNISNNNLLNNEIIEIINFLQNYQGIIYYLDFSGNLMYPRTFRKFITFVEQCPILYSFKCNRNLITNDIFKERISESTIPYGLKEKLFYKPF